MSDSYGEPPRLTELNRLFRPFTVEQRGEQAFLMAVKFFSLLEKEVPDPEKQAKLMMTWMKSIRDNNYRKFQRAWAKYQREKTVD